MILKQRYWRQTAIVTAQAVLTYGSVTKSVHDALLKKQRQTRPSPCVMRNPRHAKTSRRRRFLMVRKGGKRGRKCTVSTAKGQGLPPVQNVKPRNINNIDAVGVGPGGLPSGLSQSGSW